MVARSCKRCSEPMIRAEHYSRPRWICRPCDTIRTAAYRTENPHKVVESKRRYREGNPGGSSRARMVKPEAYRCRQDAWQYGLSAERSNELRAISECQSCGGVNKNGNPLSIDHDHRCCDGSRSCGSCVRGVLCNTCNTALGLLGDDPARIASLLKYLTDGRIR